MGTKSSVLINPQPRVQEDRAREPRYGVRSKICVSEHGGGVGGKNIHSFLKCLIKKTIMMPFSLFKYNYSGWQKC